MKNSYILNILLCLFFVSFVFSCKQVKMSEADHRFAQGEYFEAASMYRKIYSKASPKKRELRGEASYKMAECYRIINNIARARGAYANAVRYLPEDSLISLQYARILHKTGVYPQATTQYKRFLEFFPDNAFAQNGLEGIKLANEMKLHPTRYTVKRMDLFNSRRAEFSPALLPPEYDNIYFTSSRDEAQGDDKSAITGQKNNDLFYSKKDENGKWLKPEAVEGINSEFDEGSASFSATGSTMYYTYCPQDPEKPTSAGIYVSQRSGGAWSKGSPLKLSNDTVAAFGHPAIAPSGDFLYFVSDLQGGYGGKDIWRAALIGDDVSYIENLGPSINTAGDEMFPCMRSDTVMYFSSDGHPGMGGLDIFKATLVDDNNWVVRNMGVPLNSPADDFGISFAGFNETGFFSSNRGDARGYDHLFSFEYPTAKITLEGFVVNKNDEFIQGATIRVVGNDGTNEKFMGRNDGSYRLQIGRGTDYVLLASAEGHLNAKMDLATINMEKDSLYYVDFVLYSINKPNILENIFYDFDKATLRDSSKVALDELIGLLELNPNVTIELSAHTDRKGANGYNQRLSLRRAQSVVNYLIAGGIAKERLVAAGYGEERPMVVTKNIAKKYDFLKEEDVLTEEFILTLSPEQQEIADQINRRTEFKVLSITYGIK
ncbi:OmpA family protein [Viscerimonas tarda]